MTELDSTQLQLAAQDAVDRHGGVRAAARVLKISAAYLSRLRSGEKIWPDDRLLRKLGVRRIVTYSRLPLPQGEKHENG